MQICPSCQSSVRDQARFCSNCGSVLTTSAAPPTGLLPPHTLLHGRYLVLAKVAQGGMSAVYQAADVNQPGTLWAIKEMSETGLGPAERPRALAEFQREANLLLNLRHPNLPSAIDLFEEAGKHFLVMAFVDGETLEQRLERGGGPLPVADVVAWAGQLCDVLAYLHAQRPPIIYRDLKPANVMIDPAGAVQLIDFGIARFHKPGQSSDTTRVGTEGYASPEHYGQGQTEARSDLYTLGATLYHLLTGQPPPTAIERLLPPPAGVSLAPLSQVNPAIPPGLEAAILRALELRLDARFGDPERPESALAEMKAALQGKAAAQPQTKPCPGCGKPNLAASLACFACGYDFQTGRTPLVPPPALAPVPVSGPVGTARLTPYTLSTGHIAAAPIDLPATCDADWDRAVDHFCKGYITDWLRDGVRRLRAVHQHGPADDLEQVALRAEAIVQRVRRGDKRAQNAGLEEFLESLGAPPPVLDVASTTVDFGTVGQGEAAEQKLTLHNRGRGYLAGTVQSHVPWLRASPDSFGCVAGDRCSLRITPNVAALRGGRTEIPDALRICSNGGDRSITVQIMVRTPVLEVDVSILDMGVVGQDGIARGVVVVRNGGYGLLSGTVRGQQWLTVSPDQFQVSPGNGARVEIVADASTFRAGDVVQTAALAISSNGGHATLDVLLQVPPPRLHVVPAQIDLGSIDLTQAQSKSCDLAVYNTGVAMLDGQVSVDAIWLTASPTTLHCQPGQSVGVRLATTEELSIGDSCQIVHIVTNGGTVDVPVSVCVPFPWEPEMMPIPECEFLMGSHKRDGNSNLNETPEHPVRLDGYRIGKYPITNLEYSAFVNATDHKPPRHWPDGHLPQGKEHHPVVQVTWHDAVAYCKWLAGVTGKPYRLPTEAEWENAARGPDGLIYPWGNEWDPRKCNGGEGSKRGTTPVGTYSPAGDSPYGCADMAGNVWEWCADWYGRYDREYHSHSPLHNPQGPETDSSKVIRGGATDYGSHSARAVCRWWDIPLSARFNRGFRCACSDSGT